ncbi:CLIP domain-containing serine protease HP8-like isoform X2 [Panulirus ornatus]
MAWLIVTVMVMMVMEAHAQHRGASCQTADDVAGVCDSLNKCPPLSRLLQQVRSGTAPQDSLKVLQSSICHFDNGEPLLCCSAGQATPTPTPPKPSQGVLPARCGHTRLADRIIDGEDAPLSAWPWMVLLRGTVDGHLAWFCGGTILSELFVLTAAHCFKPELKVDLHYARIGEHTLSQNPDCEGADCAPIPQDITVAEIILHPQYDTTCKECNDIALLKLSAPAQFDDIFVMPICLPVDPLLDLGFGEEEFVNKYVWAAGWGSTARDPSIKRQPDTLQQVLLPLKNTEHCNSLKGNYPDPRMVLCAGGDGKDTCSGDSGGPITLFNGNTTKSFVVGVTSLGPVVCGTINTQGIYTNVLYYMDWILRTMQP